MAPKKENGDTERNGTILWWKSMKMAIKNEKDDINGNKKRKWWEIDHRWWNCVGVTTVHQWQ